MSVFFVDVVSEIEIYLSTLIQIVIIQHPKKLGSANFSLKDIIDSESVEELVARAADEYINKLVYKKPMEYLDSICETLSLNKQDIDKLWLHFIEAKARRDLGVHNSWICNSTYLRKLKEADINTNAVEGDLMTPTNMEYLDEMTDKLGELVGRIASQLEKKHS